MTTWLIRDFGFRDEDFAGIVDGRLYHGFLQRQQDIRYASIGVNQDLLWAARTAPPDIPYLQEQERTLGFDTIWRLLDAERWIKHYDYDQSLSAMTLMLKFYEREFSERRPDVVLGFGTSTMYALACRYVARRLGIPYFDMFTTRIFRRHIVEQTMSGDDFRRVNERFRQIVAGATRDGTFEEAREYIERFRATPLAPDGLQRALKILGGRASLHPRRLIGLTRVSYWYYFGHYRRDPEQLAPARQVVDALKMNARRRALLRTYFESPRPDEKFAYFALQHQPEMTTMILAPFWQDQPALVENIARSLPAGMRLYVKEHLSMLGARPLSYYRRLKAMPNVRLIHPTVSSLELARRAAVVLTITGTVGFEALLLGRPVITFGDIFYNAVPSIQKCRATEDLPGLIRACLEVSPHDETYLTAFVAALIAESFEFDAEVLSDPYKTYDQIRDSTAVKEAYGGFLTALRTVDLLPERASPHALGR